MKDYQPVSREQLEIMNQNKLAGQKELLRERYISIPNAMKILGEQLRAWGERTGNLDKPILYVDDGSCPCSQGGQK